MLVPGASPPARPQGRLVCLLTSLLVCGHALAQTAKLELIPDDAFIRQQVRRNKCTVEVVKFDMRDIGGARFQAMATTCTSLSNPELLETLRRIKLAKTVSRFDKPWKLVIAGADKYVSITAEEVSQIGCSDGQSWLLVKQFDHWKVRDGLFIRQPCKFPVP